MAVRLVEIGLTPGEKREIPVTKEEFLIGRGADSDLKLGASSISRHHCLLRVRGDEAVIVDLGSSNGTYLNGHRILSQAPLRNGDELRIGSFHFQVEVGEELGISWYAGPGTDPAAATHKMNDLRRQLEEAREKERGHPPGGAGGQGDIGGQGSGVS